ncbi:PepSY domain-containing protein [Azotobacter sp. CWF10]
MTLPGLAGAARGGRWRIDRPLLVLIHRYVGLTMAGFLLVAGLTGSLLAWNEELEAVLSPALFRVAPPGPEARPLDPWSCARGCRSCTRRLPWRGRR